MGTLRCPHFFYAPRTGDQGECMRKTLPGAQRQGRDKESGKRRNLIRAAWKRNGHPRRGACQAPVGALSVSDTACRVAVKSAFFIDAWPDGATLPPRAFCLFQWQTLLSACAGRGDWTAARCTGRWLSAECLFQAGERRCAPVWAVERTPARLCRPWPVALQKIKKGSPCGLPKEAKGFRALSR